MWRRVRGARLDSRCGFNQGSGNLAGKGRQKQVAKNAEDEGAKGRNLP